MRFSPDDHVAVIGLRWDRSADLAAALAAAGHAVTAIHLGAWDASPMPEPVDELLDGVDLVALIEDIDGATVIEALSDRGWEAVAPLLTDVHVVVLDRWHGWVEYGVGRDAIAWAGDHGARVLALESPHVGTDQTVRWLRRWAEELDAVGTVEVLRPPLGDEPTALVDGQLLIEDACTAWRVETVGSVDAQAEHLRAEWSMALAGRLWTPVSSTGGGSMWVQLAGSAAAFEPRADGAEPWRTVLGWEDRSTAGGGLVIGLPEDCGLAVATSTDDAGGVDAVRLAGDTDAFEGDHPVVSITTIDLSSGVLVVGAPDDHPDGLLAQEVVPGTYVVQRTTGGASGVQLRWIPPAGRPAPGRTDGCLACGESQVPVVYGYPSAETFEAAERGEVRLGGCVMTPFPHPTTCERCGSWLRRTRRGWMPVPEQPMDGWR